MGLSPQVAAPPLPPNVRAQQGPLPGTGQPGPQMDNAKSIIEKIGVDMRKLSQALVKENPTALQTLKEVLPLMSQLTSEIMGPDDDKGDNTPALPPTPGESLPPPSQSAAPGGGYLPGS